MMGDGWRLNDCTHADNGDRDAAFWGDATWYYPNLGGRSALLLHHIHPSIHQIGFFTQRCLQHVIWGLCYMATPDLLDSLVISPQIQCFQISSVPQNVSVQRAPSAGPKGNISLYEHLHHLMLNLKTFKTIWIFFWVQYDMGQSTEVWWKPSEGNIFLIKLYFKRCFPTINPNDIINRINTPWIQISDRRKMEEWKRIICLNIGLKGDLQMRWRGYWLLQLWHWSWCWYTLTCSLTMSKSSASTAHSTSLLTMHRQISNESRCLTGWENGYNLKTLSDQKTEAYTCIFLALNKKWFDKRWAGDGSSSVILPLYLNR